MCTLVVSNRSVYTKKILAIIQVNDKLNTFKCSNSIKYNDGIKGLLAQ